MKILSSLVALSALTLSTWSFAERSPDIERELRMKAEIVDAIMDGEPVELEADNHTFIHVEHYTLDLAHFLAVCIKFLSGKGLLDLFSDNDHIAGFLLQRV